MTDQVLPFQIDAGAFRGRLVRMGETVGKVLAGHQYPEAVEDILAEALALAVMLAGSLKYEGVFTLQTSGDGPIHTVVADVTSEGHVRGYAGFDTDKLNATLFKLDEAGMMPSLPHLLGAGHLAFTVDQGSTAERYQGIVELLGHNMAECAQRYFQQSEQLETAIKIAGDVENGTWHTGALMLQRMPIIGKGPILIAEEADEAWRRAVIFLESLTNEELLDPDLSGEQLLHRLYHSEGLILHNASTVEARCRCSAQKVENTLKSFARTELESLREDGVVAVTCEFCKTHYNFSDEDLDRLYGPTP